MLHQFYLQPTQNNQLCLLLVFVYMDETLPNWWMGKTGCLSWPPRIPDDFTLFTFNNIGLCETKSFKYYFLEYILQSTLSPAYSAYRKA